MKKLIISLTGVLLVYALLTSLIPPIIEKGRNQVINEAPYKISNRAQQLYDSLSFIADLHCDALLWDRDLEDRSEYGHVDLPRMRESNVALQAFTIVTKSPKGQNVKENSADAFDNITPLTIVQGQPINTWFSLFERASYQCNKLHEIAESDANFRVIKYVADLEKMINDRKNLKNLTGGFLGIEGAHCLEGDLQNIDELYDLGVRMIGPTHFFDNKLGGSAHGLSKGGLTEFGISAIRRMNELGIIVDLSHISANMIDDIFKLSDKPVIVSHTGVKGILNSSRNLSDKHIRRIAERKGLIGIGFFPTAIGNDGIKGIVNSIKYVKDLVGVEYVALGSDYDGSVTVPFDITGFPLLVDEMLQQGFTPSEIKLIMGENVKRFWLNNLPPERI